MTPGTNLLPGRQPAHRVGVLALMLGLALLAPVFAESVAVAPPVHESPASGVVTSPPPAPSSPSGDEFGKGRSLRNWLDQGEDEPARVLATLAEQLRSPEITQAYRRDLWRTRGLVAAGAGMEAEWRSAVAALHALQDPRLAGSAESTGWTALLQADGALLQAQWLDQQGQADAAALQAQQADRLYAEVCKPSGPLSPGCDVPSAWRALRLRWLRAEGQGAWVEATALAQRGLSLAERGGDLGLQAWSLSTLAVYHDAAGESGMARPYAERAERMAAQASDPRIWMRVRFNQARMAQRNGQDAQALAAMQQSLQQALRAQSPRLAARARLGLGDLLRRAGRPREALLALDQALVVVRQYEERRLLPPLMHNRGLARISVGQLVAGKADLEMALAIWQATGTRAAMEIAMREASDTLAQAGDVRGALELYHREQALRADINKANREAALAQVKERFRAESERHELELLERENELRTSRLNNRSLLERVWLLAAVLLALGAGVMVLLLLRARDSNRQLRRNEALLKLQTERDPLTGLANRRHFREVLAHQPGGPAFSGALLLLDVDHFKRINDEHGHAAGDRVLAEVARRLEGTVRQHDLVCRWGGEEFLVHAPGLQGEGLTTLALRMLQAVGNEPVSLGDGQTLPVTVSLGFAHFPLPDHQIALDWERAVNLTDMALYTAKSMGRDRAVGLSSVRATDAAALLAIERDFELARLAGDLSLQIHSRVPIAAD